ncbi:hypothetical protein IWQ60_004801 [Tieghemiomyces parasiticus]|uniref:Uncharacterized protein n=1 Tax=Tieghemiomyces parasiticus TaxID=78921 RepID=A0A9W8DZF9_9FUNG|nr:hypothetical protein IWQ60_004801 [Tieghemiomyces parasiticus]
MKYSLALAAVGMLSAAAALPAYTLPFDNADVAVDGALSDPPSTNPFTSGNPISAANKVKWSAIHESNFNSMDLEEPLSPRSLDNEDDDRNIYTNYLEGLPDETDYEELNELNQDFLADSNPWMEDQMATANTKGNNNAEKRAFGDDSNSRGFGSKGTSFGCNRGSTYNEYECDGRSTSNAAKLGTPYGQALHYIKKVTGSTAL